MPKKVVTEVTLPIILRLINSWEGKLTWQAVCDRIQEELGASVSRHGLLKYPQIVEAFKERKDCLREEVKQNDQGASDDVTLNYALEQIKQLRAQVTQLERDKKALLDRLVLWQHNLAMMPGVDLERLNNPLPGVHR